MSRKISRLKLNEGRSERRRGWENEENREERGTFTRGRRPGDGVEPGKHHRKKEK